MVQSRPITRPPRTACAWSSSPRARFHLRDHPSRRLRGQCAPADRLRAQAGSHRRRAQARAGDRRVHRLRPGARISAPSQAARRRWACSSSARPSHPPGTPGWHNSAAFHSSPRPRACTPAASMAMPSPTRSSARSSRPSAPTWARSTRWYTACRAAPQPSARRQGLHLGAQARGPLRHAARPGYRPRGRARIHAGTGDAGRNRRHRRRDGWRGLADVDRRAARSRRAGRGRHHHGLHLSG